MNARACERENDCRTFETYLADTPQVEGHGAGRVRFERGEGTGSRCHVGRPRGATIRASAGSETPVDQKGEKKEKIGALGRERREEGTHSARNVSTPPPPPL